MPPGVSDGYVVGERDLEQKVLGCSMPHPQPIKISGTEDVKHYFPWIITTKKHNILGTNLIPFESLSQASEAGRLLEHLDGKVVIAESNIFI
jgi:hypothetical protein